MSFDPFYTLAVWSVFHNRWVPLVTSQRREVVEALSNQFALLVFCPSAVVEVPGGTDDDVVRIVADLPAPEGFDAATGYRALEHSLEMGRFHDMVHPPGDPNR